MSENQHWYLENEPKPSLYAWVFRHMTMGAIWGALVFFGIIALILVFRAISFILPEDPFAALETGTRLVSAMV